MSFKKFIIILIPIIFLNSYPSKSEEFKTLFGIRLYENAEKYFKSVITLPMYYSLTHKEQSYVINTLKKLLI